MRLRRHPLIALALLVAILGVPVATAVPASASLGALPDVTWMTNGQVRAMVVSGTYLYIGGKFTAVRSVPQGTPGGSAYGAKNLARIDLTTGAGDPTWVPSVTSDKTAPPVHALAAIGDQIWVGGSFNAINGEPRLNLGVVSASTGLVDPLVSPQMGLDTSSRVQAIVAGPSLVYVGGSFATVSGIARKNLAAFHTDGLLDETWRPRADKRVFSMKLDCSGSTLFVGGQFARASSSGQPYVTANTIARFDLVGGVLDPWAVPPGTIPAGQKAYAMAPSCTRLFVGYGGSNWASAFALDNGTTGNEVWRKTTNGNVQAIAYTGERVVIGGHFVTVKGGFSRPRIAALDPVNGNVDPWNPAIEGQWGGPWAMLVEANHLWVGGQFLTVAGVGQTFLARFTF